MRKERIQNVKAFKKLFVFHWIWTLQALWMVGCFARHKNPSESRQLLEFQALISLLCMLAKKPRCCAQNSFSICLLVFCWALKSFQLLYGFRGGNPAKAAAAAELNTWPSWCEKWRTSTRSGFSAVPSISLARVLCPPRLAMKFLHLPFDDDGASALSLFYVMCMCSRRGTTVLIPFLLGNNWQNCKHELFLDWIPSTLLLSYISLSKKSPLALR